MRSREIRLYPYSSSLIVVVGKASAWEVFDHVATEHETEFRKLVKYDETVQGCALYLDSTVLLWIADDSRRITPELAGLVAHEALHATRKVMKYAGGGAQHLVRANEESWAYLVGDITEKVLDFIAER